MFTIFNPEICGEILWKKKNTSLEQVSTLRQQAESILKQQSIHRKSDDINSLRKSEIRYHGLLKNLGVGFVVHAPDTSFVMCNSKASELLGLSEDQMTGKMAIDPEWKFFYENNTPLPIEEYPVNQIVRNRQAIKNFVLGIIRPVTNDIVWVSVSGFPVLDNEGEISEIVISFIDITEQKQMDKRVRETSEPLSLFVKQLPFYFYIKKVTPTENYVLEASENFIQMLGINREQVIGKTPEELFPKEFAMQIIADDLSVVLSKEMMQKNEDFNDRNYITIKFPLIQGDKTLLAGYTIDITERIQSEIKQKELEAINIRLQKAESLGHMAGGIAHLFNNYLYVVTGNLELALDDLPEDSSVREKLIAAMKAARRSSDVSGAMLTYLGQSFIKTESLDIVGFCRKHLPDLQSQSSVNSGITIETDLIDTELLVSANANQMQQVLNHLITNACESIGENNGKISLSLTTRTIPASDISKLHVFPAGSNPSSNNYACLEITDTGCGISPEDIHKLFDPFFTTKFTGRGLGLPIVSGIVKSWGGCIGVNSEIGHGSSFMVFLPLSLDASISQTKQSVESPQAKPFSTILLVDDHAAVLKMTTIMLKKMGFEVISATDGVEAVEKFRQHKESVGCLITDLAMPRLDGWGTLSEIRKINPHIPAILSKWV